MPARLADRLPLIALLLASLAALCAVAFPLAPVEQPRVEVSWTAADGPTAIPLMPYQPVELSASVGCEAARSAPDGAVVLATVPLETDGAAATMDGLRVARDGAEVVFTSLGREIARDPASGACTYTVRSDPDRTSVLRDGTELGSVGGDTRPVVAGAFSEAGAGSEVALDLVTDTRFQTSATPLKVAIGIIGSLALIGALATVVALDRRAPGARRVRMLPARWWVPRPVDGVVGASAVGWLLIGPLTVDDGYIAGIIRSREDNGYIGNVFRWMNAPEAPFSWFYELMDIWSEVSTSPLWMRLPSMALTLLAWVLFSRGLLPRLGRFTRNPLVPWVAAVAFALWTLPFALGLRPEPWVAVGLLGAHLAVERTLATRRLLPLLTALLIAAVTTAVTPTGIVAFAPILVALVPLLRFLRTRTDLPAVTLVVLLVAAPGMGMISMFLDQSLAGTLEAVRVRNDIGGDRPWYEESKRYSELLETGSIQGALQRRLPVLLGLAGLVGAVWALRSRHTAGVARGPAIRLYAVLALSLVAMTFTPTKWTYHFGALAGLGAAALVVALRSWSLRGVEAAATPGPAAGRQTRAHVATAAALGAVAIVAGMTYAGYNTWPSVSGDGIRWSTTIPAVGGTALTTLWLVLGGLLVAAVVLLLVRQVLAPDARPLLRMVPSGAVVALLLVVSVVGMQLVTITKATVDRRDTFTLAEDSIDTITDSSCALSDHLEAEPDPAAGLLAPVGRPGPISGFVPGTVESAGIPIPGWRATGDGNVTTPWFRLDDALRAGRVPLTVTVAGERGPGDRIDLEFGRLQGPDATTAAVPVGAVALPEIAGAPQTRDPRIAPDAIPTGADVVRIVAVDGAAGDPLEFSVPRSPRTVTMTDLVGPAPTLIDWPVALLFPCQDFANLTDGLAQVPSWRISTPMSDDRSAGIEFAPVTGGPYTTPRMLVRSVRIPVYLRGDPLLERAALYRWIPVTPVATPRVESDSETVASWRRDGRVTVFSG